jgi:hypothetical protein
MLETSSRLKQVLEAEQKAESKGAAGAVTRVGARAVYNLQLEASADGFKLLSDEKYAKGGTDTGPAPIRFFLAGILMNLEVKFIKSATLMDVSLEELDGDIAGHRHPKTGPAGGVTFAKITAELRVRSSAGDDRILELLEEAIRDCGSLHAVSAVPVELTLVHNGKTICERTLPEPPAQSKALRREA